MIFKCPKCGTKHDVDLHKISLSGKYIQCSSCGGQIPVGYGSQKLKEPRKSSTTNLSYDKSANVKRVLIADKDAYYRAVINDKLAEIGFEVLEAEDGEKALQIVKRELPYLDLLIIQVDIPKMNGLLVISEVRKGKLGRDLPILMIADEEPDTKEINVFRKLGATGFFSKKVTLDNAVFRIKKAIQSVKHADPQKKT